MGGRRRGRERSAPLSELYSKNVHGHSFFCRVCVGFLMGFCRVLVARSAAISDVWRNASTKDMSAMSRCPLVMSRLCRGVRLGPYGLSDKGIYPFALFFMKVFSGGHSHSPVNLVRRLPRDPNKSLNTPCLGRRKFLLWAPNLSAAPSTASSPTLPCGLMIRYPC